MTDFNKEKPMKKIFLPTVIALVMASAQANTQSDNLVQGRIIYQGSNYSSFAQLNPATKSYFPPKIRENEILPYYFEWPANGRIDLTYNVHFIGHGYATDCLYQFSRDQNGKISIVGINEGGSGGNVCQAKGTDLVMVSS